MKTVKILPACVALALTASVGLAGAAEPVISERHTKPPVSQAHSIRAKCGSDVVVSWTARAEGRRTIYESFDVAVGGVPILTQTQAVEAVTALNRLHDRFDFVLVGGRVRCDASRPVGTVMFFNDTSRRSTLPGYLFMILGSRQQGLLFKPSSGPPMNALAYTSS